MKLLTLEEAQRVRDFVEKCRGGEIPDRGQIQEYNRLIRRLQESDDPGVWPLVALGVFLDGITGT